MILPPGGEPGMILIRDHGGNWTWKWPSETRRSKQRFVALVWFLFGALCVGSATLLTLSLYL